jgi:hypothetical protein
MRVALQRFDLPASGNAIAAGSFGVFEQPSARVIVSAAF